MKSLRFYISCLLALSLLAGCGNRQAEGPYLQEQPEASSQVAEVPTPIVETEEEDPEPEPLRHGAVFVLDLDNGALSADFSYGKTHKLGDTFLLGKGFTVSEMLCDGEEVSWIDSMESILLDGYYPVNQYTLPAFEDNLAIRYTGSINGSSRYTSYSRAFTLLRLETFCYPLFGADFDNLLGFLDLDDPFYGALWPSVFLRAHRPVQRSHFFDEGVTCYLQARVAGHLWGEETYFSEIEHSKQRLRNQSGVRQVPVAEYGVYDYGMLSYNIGPIFFDELAKLVGTESLDAATSVFPEQYRETPVNFDLFVDAYTALLDHPELENFFGDWLYSTEGIQRVLDT